MTDYEQIAQALELMHAPRSETSNNLRQAAEIVRAFGKLQGDMPSGWSLEDIQQMAAGWVRMYERQGSMGVNETEVHGLMRCTAQTLEHVLTTIQSAKGEGDD